LPITTCRLLRRQRSSFDFAGPGIQFHPESLFHARSPFPYVLFCIPRPEPRSLVSPLLMPNQSTPRDPHRTPWRPPLRMTQLGAKPLCGATFFCLDCQATPFLSRYSPNQDAAVLILGCSAVHNWSPCPFFDLLLHGDSLYSSGVDRVLFSPIGLSCAL